MSKDYFTRGNFFKSKTWNDCKAAYLEEVRDLCELCLKEGRLVLAAYVYLRVSPRKLNLDDPDLVIDPENLVAVCQHHRDMLHRQKRRQQKGGRQ